MFEKITQNILYWLQIFLLPVYGISFLTPRSRKIWLFGSTFGKRFADNPRYLFMYINQFKKSEIKAIWISHDREIVWFLNSNNLEAYYYRSLKGIYYCLRAGAYIFDNYSKDISFWLSGGAKKINLWHGTGNKKINYDNKFDVVRHPKNNWERFRYFLRRLSDEKPSHYILATSALMGKIFASAFQVDSHHILIDGYPRNDVLFNENQLYMVYTRLEEKLLHVICQLKSEGKKILMYMPTFRESESLFFEVVDLEKLNWFMKKRNLIFFTKLHPKSKLKKQFSQVEYSNIINISAEVDPYVLLKYVDMLVTDYSSVYTDYLMLNRPTVLFTYDLEEYSKNTRECYFDYDEYIPELRTYTMQELMDGIDLVMRQDQWEEGRLKLREKMFRYVDCKASERLCNKIKAIV